MQACHSAKHPAVVGATDETEQKSERAKPSTARGLDAFVGAVSNTRVPTSSARVPRVPLAQPQLAVLVSAITSLAVSVTAGRGCEAGDGRAERPHVMLSTVAIVRVTCSGVRPACCRRRRASSGGACGQRGDRRRGTCRQHRRHARWSVHTTQRCDNARSARAGRFAQNCGTGREHK